MEPQDYLKELEGQEPVRLKAFIEEDQVDVASEPPPNTIQCEKCFHWISISEHPFCPHGFGANAVISDEIVGGMVMDHVYPGRKVYSKSELKHLIGLKGWRLADGTTEANHQKFLRERGEYAGDTQKQRDRERLER